MTDPWAKTIIDCHQVNVETIPYGLEMLPFSSFWLVLIRRYGWVMDDLFFDMQGLDCHHAEMPSRWGSQGFFLWKNMPNHISTSAYGQNDDLKGRKLRLLPWKKCCMLHGIVRPPPPPPPKKSDGLEAEEETINFETFHVLGVQSPGSSCLKFATAGNWVACFWNTFVYFIYSPIFPGTLKFISIPCSHVRRESWPPKKTCMKKEFVL